MSTAGDIITDAYLFAGIGDVYNPLDANTSAMALRFLNNLLDSESVAEYSLFDTVEGAFNLVNGRQTYLMGPGSTDYNIRPADVSVCTIVDANNVTHPLQILGVEDWASQLIYKPAPGRPEYVYFDNNVPQCGAWFWPLPSFSNDVCHIWYDAILAQFTSLAGTLVAPPAYEWWLKTELARAVGEANNKPFTPGKEKIAQKAYVNMRALNRQAKTLDMDVPSSDRGSFNIYTGNNNP